MVFVGKMIFIVEDIVEVFGFFCKEEVERYFKVFDEVEIGDFRLEEMEWIVVEVGCIC